MSRTFRSLQTLFSGAGFSVITALLAIATTPLILNWLGDERFGAFRAALDWFGYISLLEFGIGGALVPLYVKAIATGDRLEVINVSRAGLKAFRRIAMLMLVCGSLLTVALPWLINAPEEWFVEVWLGGLAFSLGTLLTPFLAFRPLLDALQRGAVVHLLVFMQSLGTTALGVLAAGLGSSLSAQLIAYTLGVSILPLSLFWIGFRSYPELWHSSAEPISLDEVWSLSWPTFGFNLCSRVALLTDNIVVAAVLGPSAVAPFFVTQRLIALAGTQVQGVANATWAGVIDLYMLGKVELFHRRLLQTTRIATMLGFAVIGPIAVWNSVVIDSWVGSERYGGMGVTWLASINAIMLGSFSVLGWPLMATGKVRDVLRWAIRVAVVNITATVSLTYLIGPTGPLWGTWIAFTFVNIPATLIMMKHHFQLRPRQIILAVLPISIVGIIYTLILVVIRDYLPFPPSTTSKWLRLLVALSWIGVSALAFLPLGWYFGLQSSDRKEWGGRLRGWIVRKRASPETSVNTDE
jgi:O-antigen/teichoic acid export membrane protein